MAFSDIAGKAISEAAVMAAHKNMAKLSLFAKSFNPAAGVPYASVGVPVYDLSASATFSAGVNDYGTGVQEVGGVMVNLNQHLVKSISITDRQLAETGIAWVKDAAAGIADSLTRGINSYVFGLINDTNCTLSSTLTNTKAGLASLYAVAENNDIPVDRCVVVLGPTDFAAALSVFDANIYGGSEAIQEGLIPRIYGFAGLVCSSNLPSGTKGAIIMKDAIGIVNRYLEPGTAGAYPEAYQATDEDGFTLGFRRFMNLNTGADMFAGDCLFGAKVIQPNKIVRLV